MSTAERMTRQATEQSAERLGEPVVGVALVNRCGTLTGIVTSTLIDLDPNGVGRVVAAPDAIRRAGRPVADLPSAFLLSLTATQVHVFTIRMAFSRLKVKDEIGVLDRAGLQLQTADQGLVLAFAVRSGDVDLAFEIMTSDYATDFAHVLGVG